MSYLFNMKKLLEILASFILACLATAFVVGITLLVIGFYRTTSRLEKQCLADGNAAYVCYGIIYGGRR